MPTVPQLPIAATSLWAPAAAATSLARAPPATVATSACGSTATSRIPVRSMTSPPSRRARPAQSWPPARPRVACRRRRSPAGGARLRSRCGSPSHRVRHRAAPHRIWSTATRPRSLSSLDPLKPASSHSFAPRPTTAEAAFRFAARAGSRWRLRRPCPALAANFCAMRRTVVMAPAKCSSVATWKNRVSAVAIRTLRARRRGPRPLRRLAR